MLHTTLRLARKAGACGQYEEDECGYNLFNSKSDIKYQDDDLIPLSHVFEVNGIEDAVWLLKCTVEDSSDFCGQIAIECAKSVLHIFENECKTDPLPRNFIDACKAFIDGDISKKDLLDYYGVAKRRWDYSKYSYVACAAANSAYWAITCISNGSSWLFANRAFLQSLSANDNFPGSQDEIFLDIISKH